MSYEEFQERFQLRPIKNEEGLTEAVAIVDALVDKDRDEGEDDYLEVLGLLVHDYEKTNHPMPSVSEQDVLRHLMDGNNLSHEGLANETGVPKSEIDAIMAGGRMTREHMEVFGKRFRIVPSSFME